MITRMIFDVMEFSAANLRRYDIRTPDDARRQKRFMVGFSPKMQSELKELRSFLKEYFYTTTPIARMDMKSQRLVEELFALFMNDPKLLPMEERRRLPAQSSDAQTAEVICDYIANMTDTMAIEEHRKLFDPSSRF